MYAYIHVHSAGLVAEASRQGQGGRCEPDQIGRAGMCVCFFCVCMYIHLYSYVLSEAYVYTYVCVYVHTYVHTYMYVNIYICSIYTHICTYIHMYVHIIFRDRFLCSDIFFTVESAHKHRKLSTQ